MAVISTPMKRTRPAPSSARAAEQRAFDLGFYRGFGVGAAQGNRRLGELRREFSCLPIPPKPLRLRAGGDPDRDKFLGTGQIIYSDLKRLAAFGGKPFPAAQAVCDFGCGPARVTRFCRAGGTLTGIDIDADAIAWCRANLADVGTFMVAPREPPLALPEGAFDLIFAVSVFTHLPPRLGEAWLRELNRLLSADGVLIVTLPNRAAMSVAPKSAETVAGHGVSLAGSSRADVPPGGHCPTAHGRARVAGGWSELVSVAGYFPKAVAGVEDAVVCRKRHVRGLNRGEWPMAPARPTPRTVR